MTRRLLAFFAALATLLALGSGVATADDHGHGRGHKPAPPPPPAPNPNCSLVVPADPLSAAGLATPYQLFATDRHGGACDETNAAQAAFVEAAVLDPATGAVSIYHPLVVNRGDAPAVAPVVPALPVNAVVGVWFGYNGDTLALAGPGSGQAVNGLRGSLFGQYAYINAPAFFAAANTAITAGKLAMPPLGTAKDGLPCPTTRDFSVVDQDQSDNVATTYRLIGGKIAQNTAANRALPGSAQVNGSDEALLARFIDPALGCTPFTAPSLDDPGVLVSGLALNELSAAANQQAPAALVPLNDPMTLVNDHQSGAKTNLYRAGVDMPRLPVGQGPQEYCRDLMTLAPARWAKDADALTAAASPDAGVTLLDFLKARLAGSVTELGCKVPPAPHNHRGNLHERHHHRGRDD